MKTIYFVRHGETDANAKELVSGSGNDIQLNATGRKQALKTGKALKDVGIELIVCSPMVRTIETATIIAKEIGYNTNSIVKNPLFIERNCGVYEGKSTGPWYEDIQNDNLHKSVETTEEMYKRLERALQSLTEYPEDKILVVSHGGAGRAVHAINRRLHHSQLYDVEKLGNAEVYEFQL